MGTSNRLQYMDMAKGLGILGVIIGHHLLAIGLPNPYPLFVSWFWSFHMPMFFIISGYFIKHIDIKQTIIKGVSQLLIPYYITCFSGAIIVVLLVTLKNGIFEGPPLHKWLFGLFCFKGEYEQMAMWFLPVLFFSRVLFVIITKYTGKYNYYLIIILFQLLLWIKSKNCIVCDDFFLVVVKSVMAVFFVSIGFFLREYDFLSIKVSRSLLFFIFVILLAAPVVVVDMGAIKFPLGLFSAINTTIISVSIILLFKQIERFDNLILKPVKRYLQFSGEHSLSFLCLHAFIYTINLHKHLPFSNPMYHGILVTAAISIFVYFYFIAKKRFNFV